MSRRTDQLDRIEKALERHGLALGRLADLPGGQRGIHARLDGLSEEVAALAGAVRDAMAGRAEHDRAVAADAKAARTAAESAFVATQVLAAATGPQPVVSMPAPPEVKPAKGTKGGTA